MFKFTTTLLFTILSVTSVYANQVKFNLPIAAYHTSDRHDGGNWNEFFLDDPAFGLSVKNDDDIGISLNYAHKNSYGDNSSFYATADYQPTVYDG